MSNQTSAIVSVLESRPLMNASALLFAISSSVAETGELISDCKTFRAVSNVFAAEALSTEAPITKTPGKKCASCRTKKRAFVQVWKEFLPAIASNNC